jgi:hypothetical protein
LSFSYRFARKNQGKATGLQQGLLSVFIHQGAFDDVVHVYITGCLPDKIMATPAIAGNDLFVRTSDYLYAFAE